VHAQLQITPRRTLAGWPVSRRENACDRRPAHGSYLSWRPPWFCLRCAPASAPHKLCSRGELLDETRDLGKQLHAPW